MERIFLEKFSHLVVGDGDGDGGEEVLDEHGDGGEDEPAVVGEVLLAALQLVQPPGGDGLEHAVKPLRLHLLRRQPVQGRGRGGGGGGRVRVPVVVDVDVGGGGVVVDGGGVEEGAAVDLAPGGRRRGGVLGAVGGKLKGPLSGALGRKGSAMPSVKESGWEV